MRRLLVGLLVLGLAPTALADELCGPATVIDGDTLAIGARHIRLHGIDAPEMSQSCDGANGLPYRCGELAKERLESQVGTNTIRCQGTAVDIYGRLIAKCWVGSMDLSAWMTRNGFASAYKFFARDYVEDENAARNAQIGIWQGKFEKPWDWKRAHDARTTEFPKSGSNSSSRFRCDGKRYCNQMTSCDEANYYLKNCGLIRLDGDGDGVPCEAICR